MFKKYLVLISILISSKSFSAFDFEEKIQKFNWNGVEVVYLENNRFATYDVIFYFADGALSDEKGKVGTTWMAFDGMGLGTNKYTKDQILDNLEFLGGSAQGNTTHEFTTVRYSGLAKDINPAFEMICHLYQNAQYPQDQLEQYRKIALSSLQSMPSNPRALSERVYREIELEGTPYAYPAKGKMSDIQNISPKDLQEKMQYFVNHVKKRIYLTGPKSILSLKDIVINKCGFKSNENDFVRKVDYKISKKSKGPHIIFAPIDEGNQTQVKIGRFISKEEDRNEEMSMLVSEYLGGGFSSVLMKEVRVKRGLTYGIGAIIGYQKDYGRADIMTSTKNESTLKAIEVIKNAVHAQYDQKIKDDDITQVKSSLIGSYPFRFEETGDFLEELVQFDHVGRSYSEIAEMPEMIKSFSAVEVSKYIQNVFDWQNLNIFVLGNKSMLKDLKKLGPVRVVKYSDYL